MKENRSSNLAKEILLQLKKHKVKLKLNDNNIEIVSHDKILTQDLIETIKVNKEILIDYLKNADIESLTIPLVKQQEKYPLSSGQYRLWVVDKFEGDRAAFNMPYNLVLNHEMDIEILNKSVYAVVERHEILRTIFEEDNKGQVWQKVIPPENFHFKIDYCDFRSHADPLKAKDQFIINDSATPFNLSKGPLLRVALIQTADDSFTFYYNLHHIICDGWSLKILSQDVLAYYNGFKNDTRPAIPELRIQYKDYASWQLAQLKKIQINGLKEYWKNVLAGEITLINLPSNKNRPKQKTYNGNSLQTYISSETTQKLKKISNLQGGTLFMGILASLNVLIYKYTSEKDIIIGSSVTGRDQFELEDQIGFYLNIIPYRNQIDPSKDFMSILDQIKGTTLSAYKHQSYPFDQIVEDLNIKYDMSRSPIFDISLTFNNLTNSNETVDINKVNNIAPIGTSKCKNDVEFHFEEIDNCLSFGVNYNCDVYEYETMYNFMQHYKNLLEELLKNPNESIEKLSCLTAKEKNQLLNEFIDNKIEFNRNHTVLDLFLDQVKKSPDAIAIVYRDRKITYIELNELSNKIANLLVDEYQVKSNDIIGIELDRSNWMIVAILGVLKAGAAYVPINPLLTLLNKKHIIKDTETKLIITESSYIFDLDYFDGSIFAIDIEMDYLVKSTELELEISPCDLAYVIYTSGTTGTPKGVMIAHKSLTNSVISTKNYYAHFENLESVTTSTPFSFDASVGVLWASLTCGYENHILSESDLKNPSILVSYLTENRISAFISTPALYDLLLKELNFGKANLKRVILGGDSITLDIVKRHFELHPNCKLFNEYGPTENTVLTTIKEIHINYKSNIIGKPIANNQIYILDKELQLLPIDVRGEMFIGGDNLALGYLKLQEITNEKFIENPFINGEKIYRTGDFGRWNTDGEIEFLGREDKQVKIRGFRVELGEIENVIIGKGDIHKVVVLDQLNLSNQKELIAYFISDKEQSLNDLKLYLSDKLPEFMIPTKFIQLDKFPLNRNGKIDKYALSKEVGKTLLSNVNYVDCVTDEEKLLEQIIKEILELERVGINDDFFDIGGNSLKLIELVTKLKDNGYRISIPEILKSSKVKDIALLLEKIDVGSL